MLTKADKIRIFKRAKELVEDNWTKGTFAKIRRGKLCLCGAGALRLAYLEVTSPGLVPSELDDKVYVVSTTMNSSIRTLLEEVDSECPEVVREFDVAKFFGSYVYLTALNDNRRGKKEMVARAFQRAIDKYQAAHKKSMSRRRLPRGGIHGSQ